MRARKGAARRQAKKRLFKEAKGNFQGRHNRLRVIKETILRGRAFGRRDRRSKKREFRSLWITRLSAACDARGLRYSEFIHLLVRASIGLNRKTLSELAIHNPEIFDKLVQELQPYREAVSAA